jgi:quercetin dioxygenase-like cupin family protein
MFWTVTEKEVEMAGLVRMSLDSPEEVRPFEGGTGQFEVVNTQGGRVGRATLLPGWRSESCEATHTGYFISGRMKVVMSDGEEMEYGPGDFGIMPPGHDAWVIGDEPCVVIDWQGYGDNAER